ncbi:Pyrrolo-quinoline quinone [Candidatus Sulfopaludibacter sp. SbA4]|nr:Pyrrolo-quinoline quinone [Candidatus Sulfopaludibacter sp. SbA4]
MSQTGRLFIGIKGTAVALDRASGQEVWRTRLKGDFVNVVLDNGDLYAAAHGELYCLDPATGQIRWRNELKGLGRGLISIASAGQQTILLQKKKQDDEAAAAATAASTG